MAAVRLDVVPDISAEPTVRIYADCRLIFTAPDIRRIHKCILQGYAVCKIIVNAVNNAVLHPALYNLYSDAAVCNH